MQVGFKRKEPDFVALVGGEVFKFFTCNLQVHGRLKFDHRGVEWLLGVTLDLDVAIDVLCGEHKLQVCCCGVFGDVVEVTEELGRRLVCVGLEAVAG